MTVATRRRQVLVPLGCATALATFMFIATVGYTSQYRSESSISVRFPGLSFEAGRLLGIGASSPGPVRDVVIEREPDAFRTIAAAVARQVDGVTTSQVMHAVELTPPRPRELAVALRRQEPVALSVSATTDTRRTAAQVAERYAAEYVAFRSAALEREISAAGARDPERTVELAALAALERTNVTAGKGATAAELQSPHLVRNVLVAALLGVVLGLTWLSAPLARRKPPGEKGLGCTCDRWPGHACPVHGFRPSETPARTSATRGSVKATAVRPGYRPALDGVRAIAVLAVIAYHFGEKFPGGFLGVDIFFVLSGYLITGLLLKERARGRISLPLFWARRARRLLPALLIVVAACAIWIQQAGELASFEARRGDLLSALFYFANWHFSASDQSYFAAYLGASPLRHTWSLAIEEQFYLLWPLVIVAVTALRREWSRLLTSVILIGIVGSVVAMAVQYDPVNPSRAYYGSDARAQLLLVGAALAHLVHRRPRVLTAARVQRGARVLAPLAVIGIAVAFVTISDQDSVYYHGGALAFAVLVAVGLWAIEAAPHAFAARWLSAGPVRWTGQISYGLYLWHWPVLLWASEPGRLTAFSPRGRQVFELALTFALASGSFYVVERPVRTGRVPWLGRSLRRLVPATAMAVAAVALLSVTATAVGGSALARQVNDHSNMTCPAGSPAVETFAWCLRVEPRTPGAPILASTGDSTSLALAPGLEQTAKARGWGFVQAGHNGCSFLPLPFVAENAARTESRANCSRFTPIVQRAVLARFPRATWIVSDRLALLPITDPARGLLMPGDASRERQLRGALVAAIDRLAEHGGSVILLSTPPSAQPVSCALTTATGAVCRAPGTLVGDPRIAVLNEDFRSAAQDRPGRAVFVDVRDTVCPRGPYCPPANGDQLIRYDGVHYTDSFSRRLAPEIIRRAMAAGLRIQPR
jgi:peptidoglycan/LPS O-acetylase OafA/YrhL